jgi:ubiquinone/menaquinone biosynthesis C-methylase UbiE
MKLRESLRDRFVAVVENLFVQPSFSPTRFEQEYIEVRKRENRLYSDDIVRSLPDFDGEKKLRQEWKVRKSSMTMLTRYLNQKKKFRRILELGCGNGWLANHLAQESRETIAMDVNRLELEQGARIFRSNQELTFVQANIFEAPLPDDLFDCIILASSFQYFQDATVLLHRLRKLLSSNGEIHILDTPLYYDNEIADAKSRSEQYFRTNNSEMKNYYFHHTWNVLDAFNPEIIKRPSTLRLFRKLRSVESPFPWIRITK